jgi:galactokinase
MESFIEDVTKAFRETYSGEPRLFRAPGRVNLIGEHTDYNQGLVMPFAIDRETVVAARVREDSILRVSALDPGETAEIDLSAAAVKQRGTWVDYVEGTARCVAEKFGEVRGADLVFSSTVPIGAGLSSSAALEVGIGFALLSLAGVDVDREKLAFSAQAAEHDFVGIRSGIMDQFASAFGQAGHAMLLDCRSLVIEQIPLALDGVMTAVCDSSVKHSLASTEYNARREQCEEGVRLLSKEIPDIRSLRDVSWTDLEEFGGQLPEVIFRRCRHVVTENQRALATAEAMKHSDPESAGRLMKGSHRSLRDDYEVSCVELDTLVDAASRTPGVYGARMTGGGFGGCTVNLLRQDSFESFCETVTREYFERFRKKPAIYAFDSANGASEIGF